MKDQNVLDKKKEDLFILGCVFGVACIFFNIIWPVIFPVDDDIMTYMYTRQHTMMKATINAARSQGRFSFLILLPITYIPYLANNFVVYKVISYSAVCFSALMLWRLIKNNFDIKMANLVLLVFFAFAQIDSQHNLFIAYAFTHSIAIGILLLGFDKFFSYYRTQKKRELICSAALLFVATIIYEAFACFMILFFAISIIKSTNDKKIN